MKALLYNANGVGRMVAPLGDKFTESEIESLIEGKIESIFEDELWMGFADKEGQEKGRGFNHPASYLADTNLCGNVVFVPKELLGDGLCM